MRQLLENDLIGSSVHTSDFMTTLVKHPKSIFMVVHYLFIAACCFSGIIFMLKFEWGDVWLISHKLTPYLLSGQFCLHSANCEMCSCVGAAFNCRLCTPEWGLLAQAPSHTRWRIVFRTAPRAHGVRFHLQANDTMDRVLCWIKARDLVDLNSSFHTSCPTGKTVHRSRVYRGKAFLKSLGKLSVTPRTKLMIVLNFLLEVLIIHLAVNCIF